MSIHTQNIANSFLFWFHIIFIFSAILVGLFLSPWTVIILIVLHRLHMVAFKGCLLSRLQNRIGGLPKDMSFLQLAAKKIFQKNISLMQSQKLDYFLAGLALIISLAK